jgi:hypothetical protein
MADEPNPPKPDLANVFRRVALIQEQLRKQKEAKDDKNKSA